jgi:hypothetical protein
MGAFNRPSPYVGWDLKAGHRRGDFLIDRMTGSGRVLVATSVSFLGAKRGEPRLD